MLRLPYRWIYVSMLFIATCFSRIEGFWFFSCPHGNGQGQAGDVCSAFCHCHVPNTCEAGIQRCARPGVKGQRCHATRPCALGFSCHPGVQKCFHVPRRYGEPCVAGYECGSDLSCEPGVQVCFHHPRIYNEPCSAGFSCSPGLSCQPGSQRCLHHPRQENERCSAGYACADGLACRLCDKPYATCQLARVPALTDQDYDRPFNKVAFLVTHNSFSNSPSFAVWARNQRFSVSQQLQDGVRGLMLDIYPGWGEEDARLCHASCFWSGSTNLLDTLIEIRKFLEVNTREVITVIFEDYLRNPTILKRVFDQAGISPYVLLKENWGDRISDWPTLRELRRLGRLVVFNNNGLNGFPYTEYNMWRYVRENRYGSSGQNKKECVDRAESHWNEGWNDHWSLVLINWFSTAANPLQPCLNSFTEITDKLITCHKKFGYWANFVAVNYYTAGSGGGAFQVVKWLNNMFRRDSPVSKERIASFTPFPLNGSMNHSTRANQQLQHGKEHLPIVEEDPIDEPGHGRGFHNLSDMITHILQHHSSWDMKNNSVQNRATVSSPEVGFNLNATGFSQTATSSFQNDSKRNKILKSHQVSEEHKMLPGDFKGSLYGKMSLWDVNRSAKFRNSLEKGIKDETNFGESVNSAGRQSTRRITEKYNASPAVTDDESGNSTELHFHRYIPKAVFTDASRSRKSYRLGKSNAKLKLRTQSHSNSLPHRGSHGKFTMTVSDSTRQRSSSLSAFRSQHNTKTTRENPDGSKLRNLQRQLARLKAKLSPQVSSFGSSSKKKKKTLMIPTSRFVLN